MTLDDLIRTTGAWLKGDGPDGDVVLSSRVRLARNLTDYPFLSTASATERTEIYRCVADATGAGSWDPALTLLDIDDVDVLDRRLLVERQLISRQHASAKGSRGVAVAEDESLAVMINEEDHVRIQALHSGLELEGLWERVNQADDQLSERMSFAFDHQFGYLTACPTNVGTGIRVSVLLHLPALKMAREIERVARAARDMHLAVRGLHGEGTEAIGDLYQVSNQTTLGRSETQILEDFGAWIIPKIVDYERAARDALLKNSAEALDDAIWRAHGILAGARRISGEEVRTLLSPIRLGLHTGRFDLFDLATLNELFLFTQAAHLQKRHGSKLDGDERAVTRATYIRKRIAA